MRNRLFTIVFERLPMVWFLLGLLFNATGVYVGFRNPLVFAYLLVGWFCCAYGLALFVQQIRERPRKSEAQRLSPNFISAGAAVIMPTNSAVQNEQAKERTVTE
jgi:hypothetical protein